MAFNKSKEIQNLFDSLNTYSEIKRLISEGESEGQYLECKNPISIQELDRNLKAELAEDVSGFSNTGGGIVIFGVSTTPKQGMDVLTQLEPIADIREFIKKLKLIVPLLTEPSIEADIKEVKEKDSDTRGFATMRIIGTTGDPIRALKDKKFYMRIGDHTQDMPYEIIRRMFLGSVSPDLSLILQKHLIKQDENGIWNIPMVIDNRNTTPAKSVSISVEVLDFLSCQTINAKNFRDQSHINPPKRIFINDINKPIHRGLDVIAGNIHILMKQRKNKLGLSVCLYAENMRAKRFVIKLHLFSEGKFSIGEISEDFLY